MIAAHARAEPGRFATAEAHIHAHKRSGVERGAEYWLGRCRLAAQAAHRLKSELKKYLAPDLLCLDSC